MSDFSHPLLEGLPQEQASRLGAALVRRRYEAGEIVLREGEQPDELCILASGAVCVTCRDHHGGERELARLQSGEWFGEMSLLTGEPASATVRADDAVEVWALPRAEFAALAASSPLLLERLCSALVDRLRHANERYLQALKAEVSMLCSPGDPEWAGALTRAVARSLAQHSGQRVLVVDLSRGPGQEAFPGWRAPSLQQTLHDRALLSEHERSAAGPRTASCGPSLIASEGPAPRPSQVMPILESLRDHYDHLLVYAGCDQDLGRAIARSATLALVLVREAELGGAEELAAALELADRRCDVSAVVLTEGVTAPSVGEMRRLQASVPLTLRCLVPVDVDALRALIWEEGKTTSRAEAAQRNVDWLARDIGHLKVGLALGGGGSRGYAHLGVLKVLQRYGVPIDVVTGCSIGGPIAAGVAADFPREQIKGHMDAAGRKARQFGLPVHSLLSSRGVVAELRRAMGERRFEDLRRPLGIVATDVFAGKEVLLRRGSVWRAMAASMALPGIYPPVRIGNRYLVDGGIVNPVPVSAAVAMGADLVVGVRLGARPDESEGTRRPSSILRGPSILETITHALETMQEKITETSSSRADVTIVPESKEEIGLLDFQRGPELIETGERAAEQALPQLRAAMPWLA